jgi:hypothetical protein
MNAMVAHVHAGAVVHETGVVHGTSGADASAPHRVELDRWLTGWLAVAQH